MVNINISYGKYTIFYQKNGQLDKFYRAGLGCIGLASSGKYMDLPFYKWLTTIMYTKDLKKKWQELWIKN